MTNCFCWSSDADNISAFGWMAFCLTEFNVFLVKWTKGLVGTWFLSPVTWLLSFSLSLSHPSQKCVYSVWSYKIQLDSWMDSRLTGQRNKAVTDGKNGFWTDYWVYSHYWLQSNPAAMAILITSKKMYSLLYLIEWDTCQSNIGLIIRK